MAAAAPMPALYKGARNRAAFHFMLKMTTKPRNVSLPQQTKGKRGRPFLSRLHSARMVKALHLPDRHYRYTANKKDHHGQTAIF